MDNEYNRRKSDGRRVSDHVALYVQEQIALTREEIEHRLDMIESKQINTLNRLEKIDKIDEIDENIKGLLEAWNTGTSAVKAVRWGTNITKWSVSSIAIITVSLAVISRLSDWIVEQFYRFVHWIGAPLGG